MQLLYGKPIADKMLAQIKTELIKYAQKPGLAVVLVGEDAASRIYVGLKEKRALEIGMNFFRHDFAASSRENEILETIDKLNSDEKVQGIIVQLPLPAGFDTQKIINAIAPQKDADGFLDKKNAFLRPVFPQALWLLAQSSGENLAGKKAFVLANSTEFGEVMCQTLGEQNMRAERALASELPSKLRQIREADVVVSAVGSPGLLRGEMFKEGAIVLDGGIAKVENKVLGDVDFASTESRNGFLTPVPGGVGPVTIACLLQNVYKAFEAQQKEKVD